MSEKITKGRKYHVYVVELSKKIWTDSAKFRNANPQYNPVLECLYIGMTSLTPRQRFLRHKKGHINKKGIKISSYFVEKYGLYLRPSLYHSYNPMTRVDAIKMERELTKVLRRKRYAVWSN